MRGPIEIERIILRIFKHAQKVVKVCSKLESGLNLRILEYLEMGVAKWLNSATYGKAPHLAFTDPHENQDSCVS